MTLIIDADVFSIETASWYEVQTPYAKPAGEIS